MVGESEWKGTAVAAPMSCDFQPIAALHAEVKSTLAAAGGGWTVCWTGHVSLAVRVVRVRGGDGSKNSSAALRGTSLDKQPARYPYLTPTHPTATTPLGAYHPHCPPLDYRHQRHRRLAPSSVEPANETAVASDPSTAPPPTTPYHPPRPWLTTSTMYVRPARHGCSVQLVPYDHP